MPAAGVRLSPIDVTRFEDAFETGHAMLFVELRTLRQISHPLKILVLKKIGPTLGPRRHDLGSDDFCEAIAAEKLTEVFEQGSLDSEDVTDPLIAYCQRAILGQRL